VPRTILLNSCHPGYSLSITTPVFEHVYSNEPDIMSVRYTSTMVTQIRGHGTLTVKLCMDTTNESEENVVHIIDILTPLP
jgi:hypothetical protein